MLYTSAQEELPVLWRDKPENRQLKTILEVLRRGHWSSFSFMREPWLMEEKSQELICPVYEGDYWEENPYDMLFPWAATILTNW